MIESVDISFRVRVRVRGFKFSLLRLRIVYANLERNEERSAKNELKLRRFSRKSRTVKFAAVEVDIAERDVIYAGE